MKIMNKSTHWIKKLALVGCILLGTLATTGSARSPYYPYQGHNPYMNPYEQVMVQALRARANETKYYAQYWQKKAVEMNSLADQHVAISRARYFQEMAVKAEEQIKKLEPIYPATPYQYGGGRPIQGPAIITRHPSRSGIGRTVGHNWRGNSPGTRTTISPSRRLGSGGRGI